MRSVLAFASIASVTAAVGPNVAYFRNHNMDRSSSLKGVSDKASVVLNEWDTAINGFDTKADVTVQRLDLTGSPKETVSLYSKDSPLKVANGPIYIFHNSTQLTMTDPNGKDYSLSKTDAVVWISKGSCLYFNVELSSAGEASLIAVTSDKVDWTAASSDATCGQTTVLPGAGLPMKPGPHRLNAPKGLGKKGKGKGKGNMYYNEVDYSLTNSDSCNNPLTHGENGYSQTDMPIGPLAAHYHTRGALYYNQYGTSKYNDEAAPNDTLYQGELRFVNAGVYYGPEEMDASTCFVASTHEADPAAVDPVSQSPKKECPFACMNKLHGSKEFAKCETKASDPDSMLVNV